MPPAIARVNLDTIDPQQEIVVRAGTVRPTDPTIDVARILVSDPSHVNGGAWKSPLC
jgi:hypothetical protein